MTPYGSSAFLDDGEHAIGFERGTVTVHPDAASCGCHACVEYLAARAAMNKGE